MKEIFRLLVKAWRTPPTSPPSATKFGFFEEAKAFKYSNLRRLIPFITPHWRKGILAFGLMLAGTILSLPQPFFSKFVIDDVVMKGNLGLLKLIIGAMIALLLLGKIVSFVEGYYFFRFQQEIVFEIQHQLFDRVLRLPKSFFDSKQTGYLMSRIAGDVFKLQMLFSSSVAQLAPNALKLLGGVFILLYLNWRLALIAFVITPFFFIVSRLFGSKTRRVSRAAMEKSALVFRDLAQSLSGISVVKMFTAETREQERFKERLRDSIETSMEQTVLASFSSSLTGLVGSLAVIVILWYGAGQIIGQRMTLGDFVAFNAYVAYLYGPAQMLASLMIHLQTAVAAFERVFEILDMVPEDKDDEKKRKVTKIDGRIRFENVSFSYDEQKRALQDVTFDASPGQMIALVGPSGAGKSTLVSLIIQLYRPLSGRILIDGAAISELNLRSVRERIGFVSQDVFLFDDSIRNNLRYGRPEATDEEIEHAARLAAAHKFIIEFSDGYETQVGERGIKLSAGQRQRLSIARAILKDPDVLILDEPTSALDSTTEKAIKDAITLFRGRKTIFVIAHRLSTVVSADRIFVMDKGTIVETGTHQELLRGDGLYRTMAGEQLLVDISLATNSGKAAQINKFTD